MTYIGEDAFRNCPLMTKATFGKDLCSIGEGAFEKCDALASVTFTGEIPDYYGREEEHPSFPEGCEINAPGEAPGLSETWKEKASRQVPGKQKEDDDQSSREVPYYWTQSLTGEDYRGAGYYADIVLNFDDEKIHVKINGRELTAVPYYADKNAGSNEEQKVSTDGFFCREGWISDLDYETGFGNDNRLSGVLTLEDGTTEEVIFHTGSEECLYVQQ